MKAGIELYLEGVLEAVGVVSVPGLGTFRREVSPAQLDAESDTILPPRVAIHYAPLVEEAYLLPTQLNVGLNLPESEAQDLSAEIVRLMRQQLRENGRYEWAGVGVLTKKSEGGYHFEPVPSTLNAFSGSYYGLRPVEAPDLPAKALSVSHVETETAMKQSGTSSSKRSRGIGWKSVLLLLLLPMLGLGLVQYGPFHKQRSSLQQGLMVRLNAPVQEPEAYFAEEEIAPPTAESSTTVPAPAEAEEEPTAPPVESLAMEEEASSSPQTPASPPAPAEYTQGANARVAQPTMRTRGMDSATEGTGQGLTLKSLDTASVQPVRRAPANTRSSERTHFLILGSYSSQASAMTFVRELEKEGYEPIILSPTTGSSSSFRVSVYSNADRAAVQRYAERLKREGVKSGWILTLPK